MSSCEMPIIEDPYFGVIQPIKYENSLITQRASHFFECPVDIIYTNHIAYEGDDVALKKTALLDEGFFNINGLLVPFVFESLVHAQKPIVKLDINLYLTVIYGHDQNKYQINNNIKTVFLEKTDEYLNKILGALPLYLSNELKNVLEYLYFYPYVDSINGKSLNIGYDIITKSSYFFITHYQKESTCYNNRMPFSYDGRNFSMLMNGYKNIIVNSENLDKAWGLLFSSILNHKLYEESLIGPFTDMTTVLQHVEKISSIVEMVQY